MAGWRRGALADLVEVASGDVARPRGTKGVEADRTGRGGRLERAAEARVVGGEERIDAREETKKPGGRDEVGIFGEERGDLAAVN